MNKSLLLSSGFKFLLIMCALWFTAPEASAQFSSAIQGVVQDPSRAVVPNASVTLRNAQTGLSQETKTNESGYFRFSSLAPGDYEVTAEGGGFQKRILNVTVTTGQSRDINFDLEAGQVAETVQVTSEIPPLDTAETRVQLTLEARKLRDLPC